MIGADLFNAALELVGGVMVGLHVMQAHRDRAMRGVHLWPILFFFGWGLWNLAYYPLLGQWWSAAAALAPAIANAAWLHAYWRFARWRVADDLERAP